MCILSGIWGAICSSLKDPKEGRVKEPLSRLKRREHGAPQRAAAAEHWGAYRTQSLPSDMLSQKVVVEPGLLDLYQPLLLQEWIKIWEDKLWLSLNLGPTTYMWF